MNKESSINWKERIIEWERTWIDWREKKERRIGQTLDGPVGVLLVRVALWLLKAGVLTIFWDWVLVDILSLSPINFPEALILVLVFYLFLGSEIEMKPGDTPAYIFVREATQTLIITMLATVVSLFI